MIVIPLLQVPSQSFTVNLAGQQCLIAVYQKGLDIFLDLSVNGVVTMTCVICRDRVLLVRQLYLGFVGDLIFADTRGLLDPQVSGFNTRWGLFYLSPADVATLGTK